MEEVNLKTENRLSIALLIDVAMVYYQMNVILGAVEAAKAHGINLYCIEGGALQAPTNLGNQSNVLYELLGTKDIDGILILSSLFNYTSPAQTLQFSQRFNPLPVVSIACRIEGCSSIIVDNRHGIREMIRHLVEIHHFSKFAVITGPEREENSIERLAAVRESLAHYGLSLDANRVALGNYLVPSGAEAVKTLLDRGGIDFDVILSMNDGMAWGAMRELRTRGIQVPNEIAVIGFDNFFTSVYCSPPLTTVTHSLFDEGKKGVELLVDLILKRSSRREVTVPTKLVIRESCGCFTYTSSVNANEEFNLQREIVSLPEYRREFVKRVVDKTQSLFGRQENLEELIEKMVDALLRYNGGKCEFTRACYEVLRHSIKTDEDAVLWQNILSELRCFFMNCPFDHQTLNDAEDMFHQMRMIIAEMAVVTEKISKHNSMQNRDVLNAISEELLSSVDNTQIMDVLSKRLPQLGITSGFIAALGEGKKSFGLKRRLMFAFNQRGRIVLTKSNIGYDGLIPELLLEDDQPHALLISLLGFGKKRAGFMGLEINTLDAGDYDALKRLVASSMNGAILSKKIKKQEKNLVAQREHLKNMTEMRKAKEGFILTLLRVFELKDPYTAGHQNRVAKLARAIAFEMGLPSETAEGLLMAGYLHDIGKISVPSEVLVKPVRLNEVEFALIREHVRTAFDILKNIDFPWPIARPIMEHHERLDGSGYPYQLKGEEICQEARILAVADVIEAMASHRPYRPALGINEALGEIIRNRGVLYDEHVVDACVRLFKEKRYGLE